MRRFGAIMAAVVCAGALLAAAPANAAVSADEGVSYTRQLVAQMPGDPAFRFGYEFSLGDTTPRQAMALVRDCLSCYLPLGGAPAEFPDEGAVVPFTVPAITDADDFTSIVTTWDASLPLTPGFQLTATSDNIAGDGSVVAFGFYSFRGEHIMSVDGLVMNDLGEHTTNYKRVTEALWGTFAANLAAADRAAG